MFANEVRRLLPSSCDGQAVGCNDARGRFLGTGIYNSRSQIVWRRFSRDRVELDRAQLSELISNAVSRRAAEPFRRLVWAEADDLPGLIVDQYESVLVIQAMTLAMDQRIENIAAVLKELLAAEEIVIRNDAPSRSHEGLEAETRTLSGQPFQPRWFEIDGVRYYIDLLHGQKTGYYLDQRKEHLRVAAFAPGRRVLDGFCHHGAFALHCAKAGATSVTAIDSSEDCIEQARKNADENGLEAQFRCENMFDYLSSEEDAAMDMIILDPPSFARNRSALAGALRGYKEINLRAMQRLNPGGILATYSCSQHVSRAIFMEMLCDAAADARRKVEVLALTGQPGDHPVRLNLPESEYLKGAILRVT